MRAFVYILASSRNGAIYVGVTTNPVQRMEQHCSGRVGHTARYNIKLLVHLEEYDSLKQAREREARLKKWKRAWKIALIEETNPDWRDLKEDSPF